MRKSIGFIVLGGVLMLVLVTVIVITYPQVAASSSLPFLASPGGLTEILAPDHPLGTSGEQAPLQQITAGTYLWSYSAKFVCGYQPQPPPTAQQLGEPPVKPGNYATEINIHNSNFKPTLVKKFIIILVDQGNVIGREPNVQQPRTNATVTMGANTAMLDDCNALWAMSTPGALPAYPMPLMIGYLVIVSPVDMTIDTVYTAEVPGTATSTPTGISIAVTHVLGKRVFATAGTYP